MTDTKIGLYGALAKAQAALSSPGKNREVSVKMKSGGTYKFKYTTFDHLIDHIREALTSNGLWFVQFTEPGSMVTRITHDSGEFLDCPLPMPNLPNNPQEAGSLLSYFRRYSLSAAFGLASDDDDDGNVAEGNGYEAQDRKTKSSKKEPEEMPEAEFSKLKSLAQASGTTSQELCKKYGVGNLRLLNQAQYTDAISFMNDRLAAKAKGETDAQAGDLGAELNDEIKF